MDDLAGQIVEHFPKEDKVFSKNKEILIGHTFFKHLFSNSCRNRGIIVMVPAHVVDFTFICDTHLKKWPNKPTKHRPQKLSITLLQVRMNTMKSNLYVI